MLLASSKALYIFLFLSLLASTLSLCKNPLKTDGKKHNLSTLAASKKAQQDLIQDLLAHKAIYETCDATLKQNVASFLQDFMNPNFIENLSKDQQTHKNYLKAFDTKADSYYKCVKEDEAAWTKLRAALAKTSKYQLPSYVKPS